MAAEAAEARQRRMSALCVPASVIVEYYRYEGAASDRKAGSDSFRSDDIRFQS